MLERNLSMMHWLVSGAMLAGALYACFGPRRGGVPNKPREEPPTRLYHWRLRVVGQGLHRPNCPCAICSQQALTSGWKPDGRHDAA